MPAAGARRSLMDEGEDLSRFEAAFLTELRTLPDPFVAPCRRVAGAGGKRVRPRLLLMAAACGGVRRAARLDRAAVVVELLHLATLVHDDLIEGARTRRGVLAINAWEGVPISVLTGDALLGTASRLAVDLDRRAGALVAQAQIELAAGQALEERLRYRADSDAEAVLGVARAKSGTLTRLACELATAVVPTMDAELADGLVEFGATFGTCLQLVDDVLDLIGSEETLGKPVGVDFPAGVVTLPAVAALARDEELRALLRPGLGVEGRQRALTLLRHGEGIASSVHTAADLARGACERLSALRTRGDAGAIERLAQLPVRYMARQLTERSDPGLRHLAHRRPLTRPAGRRAEGT